MPKIKSPEQFVPNIVLTAEALQNHVDGASPLPGFISEQIAIQTGVLASTDTVLVHDVSINELRKATISNIFGVGSNITTNVITGTGTNSTTITPGSGGGIALNGNVTVSGTLAVSGAQTVSGSLTSTGKVTADGTGALKIPVGTTAERPSTPVAGDIRYNSTLDQAEIYSGTEWKAVGGSPFDASGGSVTTISGYKIHTFITSGTFTPAANAEGKVEYLVVGAGGAGSYAYAGAGGGGGDVKSGFLNISKGTAPMAVVVGSGSSGTGGLSSFGGIIANGGLPASGGTGGASGSGNAGTGGSGSKSGGGGGGAGSPSLHSWTGGGTGGEGFGSNISGTLVNYGGGGGGAGNSSESGSGSGNYGAWGPAGGGRGANSTTNASAARANSGGGGGGGNSYNGRANSLGADGIVIIRYRVS